MDRSFNNFTIKRRGIDHEKTLIDTLPSCESILEFSRGNLGNPCRRVDGARVADSRVSFDSS